MVIHLPRTKVFKIAEATRSILLYNVRKLCSLTTMGPTPDQAHWFAADELPISLDLVESVNDQTLGGRVWIKLRLSAWYVFNAGQEM